jgi:outer membrane protein OmpA-like peptidoglycan-associated protein
VSRSTRYLAVALILVSLVAWGGPIGRFLPGEPPSPVVTAGQLAIHGDHRFVKDHSSVVDADDTAIDGSHNGISAVTVPVLGGWLRLVAISRPSPEPLPRKIVIRFGFACHHLQPRAEAVLRVWAAGFPGDTTATVAGHTDSVGTDEDNLRLSRARADEVAKGLRRLRMQVRDLAWFGERRPVRSNNTRDGADDRDGRRHNRRVVVRPHLRHGLRATGPPRYVAADPPGPCPAR